MYWFEPVQECAGFFIPKISVGLNCPIASLRKHAMIYAAFDPRLQWKFIHKPQSNIHILIQCFYLLSLLFSFGSLMDYEQIYGIPIDHTCPSKNQSLQTSDWNKWPWALLLCVMTLLTSETCTILLLCVRSKPSECFCLFSTQHWTGSFEALAPHTNGKISINCSKN